MEITNTHAPASHILPSMSGKLITVLEAAERLGVHRSRVHVLIREGRLPAQKFGNVYLIKESDLKLVEDRPTGRPPKVSKKGTKR